MEDSDVTNHLDGLKEKELKAVKEFIELQAKNALDKITDPTVSGFNEMCIYAVEMNNLRKDLNEYSEVRKNPTKIVSDTKWLSKDEREAVEKAKADFSGVV